MKKISIVIGMILLLVIVGIVISFFFIKEKQAQRSTTNNTLRNEISVINTLYGDWEWSYLVDSIGKTITPNNPEKFILTLSSEGKLTSTTDCNSVSGSFVVNDNVINIGPLTLTEMGCEGEMLESIYASSLASISSYTISDTQVVFNLLQNKGVMTFSKNKQ